MSTNDPSTQPNPLPEGNQPPPPGAGPVPPAGGAAYPPPPPQDGGNGKRNTIIVVSIVVVLALVAAGFFFLRPSATTAEGEIFLDPAAAQGQDAFSAEPLADAPDPEIAQPATETPPTASGTVTTTASNGGKAGLYGGSLNSAICNTGKMLTFLQSNPDKASAWVQALNADPNLRWSGGQLTTADIPAYIGGLTPIVLVSDTRVTNHGYKNGSPTTFQSVLQRGSGIFVDAYGVPRVRCYCGNPLLAPKASSGTPKYTGKSWPGFVPGQSDVISPSSTPLTSFDVRIPATPNGKVTKVNVGPKCGPNLACPPSLFKSGAQPTTPTPTPTTPVSPSGSPAPVFTPTLSTAVSRVNGKFTEYSVTLTGAKPGSKVKLVCGSSKEPSFYKTTVTVDAAGNYSKSPFCYTPDSGFFIKDTTNGLTARP